MQFSGIPEDWVKWSRMFLEKAMVSKYKVILTGSVFEGKYEYALKKYMKTEEYQTLNAKAYRDLLISNTTSDVAFSCIDFFARSASKGKTITIAKLSTEAGSPGRAFKLPEPVLLEQLEETCRKNSKLLKLTSAAGVPQLVLEKDPREIATKILFDHYYLLF